MGMHDWHSTGHRLKQFLSYSGDQKLREIVGKKPACENYTQRPDCCCETHVVRYFPHHPQAGFFTECVTMKKICRCC